MSCSKQCYDVNDPYFEHDDCSTCPGRDAGPKTNQGESAMSDLLPCPKCYTREPPKCEWDRYDSCLSCVKCNYYTGWCYVPTAKDKWNEDAKASMEPDFGGPVFHCMDMDNLEEKAP